ncbi:hypothetical protein Gasu2_34270 [Galdieria sulphuraria]|nr:hypothetical protein Gasu2_34270 [Galdieria sulphuraria]
MVIAIVIILVGVGMWSFADFVLVNKPRSVGGARGPELIHPEFDHLTHIKKRIKCQALPFCKFHPLSSFSLEFYCGDTAII